ncbi:hypothetical protein [Burkholderia guangdongensis]|nr:hypothetical protein [Burkholderia guangdongensis]
MGNDIVNTVMGIAVVAFALVFFAGLVRRGRIRERLMGRPMRGVTRRS